MLNENFLDRNISYQSAIALDGERQWWRHHFFEPAQRFGAEGDRLLCLSVTEINRFRFNQQSVFQKDQKFGQFTIHQQPSGMSSSSCEMLKKISISFFEISTRPGESSVSIGSRRLLDCTDYLRNGSRRIVHAQSLQHTSHQAQVIEFHCLCR